MAGLLVLWGRRGWGADVFALHACVWQDERCVRDTDRIPMIETKFR